MKAKLGEQITQLLGQTLPSVGEDVRKVFRARLETLLSQMDLVTREEFEVQKAVLARTQAQLAALGAEVERLERAQGPAATHHAPR
ncbi:MAG TPA: accessory factor UbiK family protein [Acidiferrobacteraceae bacterium]|nr:accessory factor UbiK family protein [Acidiferrobacteraceae bacterium]